MKLLHLIFNSALCFLVQRQLFEAFLEFFNFRVLAFFFQPQLILDRLKLFAQEELTLLGRHFIFDLLGDLGLQPGDFELFLQKHQDLIDAFADIDGGQNLLQFLPIGAGQVGCEVCQPARIVHA